MRKVKNAPAGVSTPKVDGPMEVAVAEDVTRRVEKLAALGLSNREIAEALQWDAARLRQRPFRTAIAAGRSQLVVRLRARQLQTAMEGNVMMMKELGRQHLQPEAKNSEAAPTKTLINVDLEKV